MSTNRIDDGGPAFPVQNSASWQTARGMSLRDYFAGEALQGLCANPGGPYQANSRSGWDMVNCTPNDIAACAYGLADAMLRARATKGGEA